MGTLFASVYNRFLEKITDDMYMELTPQDTMRDLQNLLTGAIPGFEFPRKSLEFNILVRLIDDQSVNVEGLIIESADGNKYEDASYFIAELTSEEINILAILMMESWLQRQVTSIENIRMKYSGSDFKMTSQANHLSKLLALLSEVQRQSIHMQRLYKRRRLEKDNTYSSNWDIFRKDTVIKTKEPDHKECDDDLEIEIILDGGVL